MRVESEVAKIGVSDRELFLAEESEFSACLRETFPSLVTRRLRRTEWRWIRRMIGKPRRCSAAFFTEERYSLERRREKIREVCYMRTYVLHEGR